MSHLQETEIIFVTKNINNSYNILDRVFLLNLFQEKKRVVLNLSGSAPLHIVSMHIPSLLSTQDRWSAIFSPLLISQFCSILCLIEIQISLEYC